jgi:hypothetical protein
MGLCTSKDAVPSTIEECQDSSSLQMESKMAEPMSTEFDESPNMSEMPFSPSHMPFSPTYKNVPVPKEVAPFDRKPREAIQLAFDSPEAVRKANPINETSADVVIETPKLLTPPMLQGFIEKQGHVVKNWKNRYFVLAEGVLRYFKLPDSSPPYGTGLCGELLHLEVYAISEDEADIPAEMMRNCDKDACHILLAPSVSLKGTSSAVPETECPMLLLQFDSAQRMTTWFAALKTHIAYKKSLQH